MLGTSLRGCSLSYCILISMAEMLLGGALLGAVVNEIVTALRKELKTFSHRNRTLQHLEARLDRLEPLVQSLDFIRSETSHPAGKWLSEVHEELRKTCQLVSECGGSSIKLMRHSNSLERINKRISELVGDASIIALLQQRRGPQRELAQHLRPPSSSPSPFPSPSPSHSPSTGQSYWNKTFQVPDRPRKTVGGEAVANGEIERIVNGEYNKWVVMWGMGRVGKTCTALAVYHNTEIQRHFSGGQYWVTVSKDQAPPLQILKQLYLQINKGRSSSDVADELEDDFSNDLEGARAKVRTSLDREKVLLVLDDVWDSRSLQGLDVLSEGKEGVIMKTTRDKGIFKFVSIDAEYRRRVAECAKIVEIPRLSEEDSWELFRWHAFDVYGQSGSVPDELEDVARAVARECKGLPLALKVIGSTMGSTHFFEDEAMMGRNIEREWEFALEQLRGLSSEGVWKKVLEHNRGGCLHDDEDARLYDRLQWSLDSLVDHDKPSLRDCLFYFAAYPEDHAVPVDQLLRMWVAEGLCNEETGAEMLDVLLAKSVIEFADGHRKTCKIHDMMRDLVQLNLKFNTQEVTEIPVSRRECLYAPGQKITQFPSEWIAPEVRMSAKRLSLLDNCLTELPTHFNAPHLQVLILRKNEQLDLRDFSSKILKSSTFFSALSKLRVLDLSETSIEKIPRSVLRNLKSLVLFDLSHCKKLRKISDELDSLKNLETLVLEGVLHLRRIAQMKNLTKMQALSISGPVSRAQALLDSFWAGHGIRHVFQMRSLHRLHINGGAPNLTEGKRYDLPEISSLNALMELRIRRCRLPEGLMELKSLKVMDIDEADVGTAMPPLDTLPLLQELTIRGCSNINSFPASFGRQGAFPSLRKLSLVHLENCSKLFTFQAGSMPKIQMLSFWRLDKLTEFPVSLKELRTLTCLYLDQVSMGAIDFERVFGQRGSFPNLERLVFGKYGRIPELPALRERQAQGKLKIERGVYESFWQS